MERTLDRVSEFFSDLIAHPERLYFYLLRLLQVMTLLTLVSEIATFRKIWLLNLDLPTSALWREIPSLGFAIFVFLLTLFTLLLSQVAVRLMQPPSSRGITALFLTGLLGVCSSPISSILLLITLFTGPFRALVQGREPEWYTKLLRKMGLTE